MSTQFKRSREEMEVYEEEVMRWILLMQTNHVNIQYKQVM